jgi:hypothetical protein
MPIIGIGRKSALRIYWPVRAQGIGGARSGRASGGTPGKPGFLRQKPQKMRPNEVLKKPSPSVDFL